MKMSLSVISAALLLASGVSHAAVIFNLNPSNAKPAVKAINNYLSENVGSILNFDFVQVAAGTSYCIGTFDSALESKIESDITILLKQIDVGNFDVNKGLGEQQNTLLSLDHEQNCN